MRKNKSVTNGEYSEKTKAEKMREYIRGKGTRNYDNIVAYQEEIDDFFYNVKLRLDSTEHAIVKCAGKDPQVFMNGDSYVFNRNDKVKWPFHEVDDNTYQITYIAAHDLEGKLTINLPKEGRNIEIPVGYKYKIKNPEKFISTIRSDESYNRYKTWTSNGLQREINQAISSLVFSYMSVFSQSKNWSRMVHYLSESIVEKIAEDAKLKRFGVSLTSLWFDLQTLAENMTDKEFVETRDQVMKALEKGFNDLKNQNIELTEGTRAYVSAVASKEAEGIKDFIAKRDGIIKDILENVKAGKESGGSSEDIKKYFDITNATVAAEINKLIDKINAGKHLSDEEFVQATKAVECTDPKDLKNTPKLTLNFILDNITEDWHASMAADAIYHQLEKWFSSKKYEDGEYKGQNMNLCNTSFESLKKLVTTYPKALDEVPNKVYNRETHKKDKSDRLFSSLTKSPEGVIKYKDKPLKEWVEKERIDKERNKNLKSRVDVSGGIRCYFAVAEKAKKSNKEKEYMSVCYDVGQFWTKTNYIRHFGPNEDKLKRKAYEVGGYTLETPQNRQKYLLAFCKLLTTGLLKEENILPIYQKQ